LEVEGRALPWRRRDVETVGGSSLVSQFVPASASNYSDDSRGVGDIDMVVIHTMEGSYSGAISWFQNGSAAASAHYMVRSSDGEITQMVDEADVAWHAGDWATNARSIGIEHEGFVSAPETWYTEAMLQSSAALVRDICDRYGIPRDRSHVIGHSEVPGCPSGSGGGSSCHTDPGSGWDWNYFMSLVDQAGGGSTGGFAGALSDGAKTGHFEVEATSSRFGITDTCSGALSGTANNGLLYLRGTCRLDDHGAEAGDVDLTFSASVQNGNELDGRVVVEGYSDGWVGLVNADGSTWAELGGSHQVGGDVGTLSYSATITTDP
jgi:hypothetical protein